MVEEFVITGIIGACTVILAIVSIWVARKSGKSAKSAAIGTTLTSCVTQYQTIIRLKYDARKAENAYYARQYFQELFSLYWNEAYLWLDGMVPDHIMLHWVNTWYLSYNNSSPISTNSGTVTYPQQWEAARWSVFSSDECFVKFMNRIHEHKGKQIYPAELKEWKREFKTGLREAGKVFRRSFGEWLCDLWPFW